MTTARGKYIPDINSTLQSGVFLFLEVIQTEAQAKKTN